MTTLNGKHALVTGASRGIGAAVAEALLRQGASVTLLARGESGLWDLGVRLALFGEVCHVAADVTQEGQVRDALARAAGNLGPIAILVNNAGQAESAPIADTDSELWQRMLDVNLSGSFYCIQSVLPAMRKNGWGRIVNLASTAGLQGYPYVAAYCAAKHGVIGLTRALALELANSGVTVNAVCPGYTDTPMLQQAVQALAAKTGQSEESLRARLAAQNPDGRLLSAEEVAQAVLRFCLPEAGGGNGEIASLNDGVSA